MKNILIVCAMENEAEEIANKMGLDEKNDIINIKKYVGQWKNSNITLLITGIGKQKAAIGVSTYLAKYDKPDMIINIGYCGATKTEVGTFVNAIKSYNYEWDIPGEQKYSMKDLGNQELIGIKAEMKKLECYSAECFVTGTDIKDDVVFDMELHSLALIADIYKIPLASLKIVSDNLDIDVYHKNTDGFIPITLENVSVYLEKII